MDGYKLEKIDLSRITTMANPCRIGYDGESFNSLVTSIKATGLLSPITLRRIEGDYYEIISGERRARACLSLGHSSIWALVIDCSHSKAAITSLVENVVRKDLNCLEQAEAMRQLINLHNSTQSQLGALLGLSQPAVANKLRLLQLPTIIRSKLILHNLSERHGRALLRLKDEKSQLKALSVIIDKGYNAHQSDRYIDRLLAKDSDYKGSTVIFGADIRIFMNTLKNAVNFMKEAGVNVDTNQFEEEDYFNVVVKIPKTAVYKDLSPNNSNIKSLQTTSL